MARNSAPTRRLVSAGLLLALVATGGAASLSLVPVWQSFESVLRRTPQRVTVSAPSESRVLSGEGVERIILRTRSGSIEVRVDDGTEAAAPNEATITYWVQARATGADEALALAWAAGLKPVASREGGGLTLTVEDRSESPDAAGHAWVDWSLEVPAGMGLDLASEHGDIKVRGPIGELSVTSPLGTVDVEGSRGSVIISGGFGDVRAAEISGAVAISTTTGRVELREIGIDVGSPGRAVLVASEFGDVDVRDVAGAAIDLSAGSGHLVGEQLRAEDSLRLSTSFGDVELRQAAAPVLEISTRGGDQRLADLRASEALTMTSRFGSLDLLRSDAPLTYARSDSGTVTLSDLRGAVRLEAGSGDLSLRGGEELRPTMRTRSGGIRFDGRIDPLWLDPARFESEFGDVHVTLRGDQGYDVALATRFGDVQIDVELEQRNVVDGIVRGRIAGGGSTVELRSTSGELWLEGIASPSTLDDS
jgi:DUF4097 and DUF4098 domain-containing protein YvlB